LQQYHDALSHILENGKLKSDRTGTGTISVFGYQMRFDLAQGFPAITTKKLAWKAVVSELLWFLEGSSDERRLCEILYGSRDSDKKTIWTENAEASYWKPKAKFSGDLGRVYGVQWRKWHYCRKNNIKEFKDDFGTAYRQSGTILQTQVDQISNLIEGIKKDPHGRRHIITAWNPAELDQMALPPCHILSQFDVTDGKLSCQMYQRSCDMFLGVPFNIASYSLLTHIIAKECDLDVGEFIWIGGGCHIYNTHISAVKEQLTRTPKMLPKLVMSNNKKIKEYVVSDFILENYNPYPAIKVEMAV